MPAFLANPLVQKALIAGGSLALGKLFEPSKQDVSRAAVEAARRQRAKTSEAIENTGQQLMADARAAGLDGSAQLRSIVSEAGSQATDLDAILADQVAMATNRQEQMNFDRAATRLKGIAASYDGLTRMLMLPGIDGTDKEEEAATSDDLVDSFKQASVGVGGLQMIDGEGSTWDFEYGLQPATGQYNPLSRQTINAIGQYVSNR